LLAACTPALRWLGGSAAEALLPDARAYTRVRALGMPAALGFMVLQSAFLGAADWRPPTAAVLVAVLFNLLADALLVLGLRLGVVGAALGTVAAQHAAAATLLLVRRRRRRRSLAAPAPPPPPPPPPPRAGVTSAGGRGRARPGGAAWLPTRAEARAWRRFGVPLVLGQLTRVSAVALVTLAATAGGAAAAAAHQVTMALFYAFCPFGDAVSQTAQTFLPSVPDGPSAAGTRRALRRQLLLLGGLTGGATAALASVPLAAPRLLRVFTPDGAVCAAMGALLPLLALCSLCFPAASAFEGVLLATHDAAFVGASYAAGPALVLAALALFRRTLGGGSGGPLVAWAAFAVFHVMRLVVFAIRLSIRS
jgi:Na+-driven multidrug efflux pump